VGADRVVLAADAEELALHAVDRGGQLALEDGVERGHEAFARPPAVGRAVLAAVGDPDVVHARRAELAAHGARDAAGGDAVADPELAHRPLGARQGEAVAHHGVGEAGGVEVEPPPPALRPVDPPGEVAGLELVAVDLPAAGLGIHGVEVEPQRARDEAGGEIEVRADLVPRPRGARVVARGLDAAAVERALVRLEAHHVVGLPALHRDGQPQRRAHRPLGVHAHRREALPRLPVGRLHLTSRRRVGHIHLASCHRLSPASTVGRVPRHSTAWRRGRQSRG